MLQINQIQNEISIARREIKNLRQEIIKVRAQFTSQFAKINMLFSQNCESKESREQSKIDYIEDTNEVCLNMRPIGILTSCFKNKNGIPRQPSLCQSATAILEISKIHFTNPEHSLIGLEEFPYIWVLFYFHKNSPQSCVKAKVHPPRLDGASVGVFSTRSPHRPCAIGLSLVKLEKISGNKLYLSGVDLLDGTPVLDIKPYIEAYDAPNICGINKTIGQEMSYEKTFLVNLQGSASINRPSECTTSTSTNLENDAYQRILENKNHSFNSLEPLKGFPSNSVKDLTVSENMQSKEIQSVSHNSIKNLLNEPLSHLNVIFTTRAENDIEKFHSLHNSSRCEYCLDFIDGNKARSAVIEVLKNDPRSVYRRKKCSDRLYFFEIDKMHVTCWFEEIDVEILRVKPVNKARMNPSE